MTNEVNFVEKTDGNLKLCIPMDEQNTDYQQYLKDVENGVEVLPADE